MQCPACQQPTFETADVCAQCGFTLAALERLMGFAPSLKPYVTDLAGELTTKDIAMVRKSIDKLQRRFPQVRCAVVVSATPANITLPLHAFWLFNKGGLCSALERGGANRLVLIVVDPEAQKLACMIGYGLEPFFNEGRMTSCLHAALPGMASDEPGAGLCAAIEQLSAHLGEVAQSMNQAFGLGEELEYLEQLTEVGTAAEFVY